VILRALLTLVSGLALAAVAIAAVRTAETMEAAADLVAAAVPR
jgi:hypothetical protein